MSRDELKQMIVGLVADDSIAIQYQTMGQYRDSLIKRISDIDIDYKFETSQWVCYVCHKPLKSYGQESPLDGEKVCDDCYCVDEYKNNQKDMK